MLLFGKDLEFETVVVAEIGVNHEGSVDKAMEMIGMAADAKADAVKFQTYDPYRYASTSDMERFERVSRFALSTEDFSILSEEAKNLNIGFFSTPLDECERRDVKGLYAKARAGELKGFTGIDDPYEIPKNCELSIDTTNISPEEAVQEVMLYLEKEGLIK